MTDLVERLRKEAAWSAVSGVLDHRETLAWEAADEIERLRADGERMAFLEERCDGVRMLGSGAADDKWWTVIYDDGNTRDDGTLRAAIDATRASVKGST